MNRPLEFTRKPLAALPLTNLGERFPKCSYTAQKASRHIGRALVGVRQIVAVGAVAPVAPTMARS